MSKASVQQVIQRAVSDAAFRRQLQREPAKALAGFDLTAEERASIAGGDPARLTALGVDQRMSKAFALGAAADASTPVPEGAIDTLGASGATFIEETSVGDTTGGATFVNESTVSDDTGGAMFTNEGTISDNTGGAMFTNEGTISDNTGGAMFTDESTVSDSTTGATAVIPGDPTAGASAFEDLDTTGDMNAIDPGLVESDSPQIAGTQVTIDDGQPDDGLTPTE